MDGKAKIENPDFRNLAIVRVRDLTGQTKLKGGEGVGVQEG